MRKSTFSNKQLSKVPRTVPGARGLFQKASNDVLYYRRKRCFLDWNLPLLLGGLGELLYLSVPVIAERLLSDRTGLCED